MKLLSESLDLVDPHHFLRLSKAIAERACAVCLSQHVAVLQDAGCRTGELKIGHDFSSVGPAHLTHTGTGRGPSTLRFSCPISQQDEVGDGIPQSIMGDYTVGAQLLRTRRTEQVPRHSERMDSVTWGNEWQRRFNCATLAEDSRGYLREIATRPPTPTRLTEASEAKFALNRFTSQLGSLGTMITTSPDFSFGQRIPHGRRTSAAHAPFLFVDLPFRNG